MSKHHLKLNGETYSLVWDFEAIALAEDISDRPLLTGIKVRDITSPTISLVRAMLYACIHTNHTDVTWDHVKAMVTRKTFSDIWVAVLTAWNAGIGETEESGDENPKTAQA
jgi:hypothetical protein